MLDNDIKEIFTYYKVKMPQHKYYLRSSERKKDPKKVELGRKLVEYNKRVKDILAREKKRTWGKRRS